MKDIGYFINLELHQGRELFGYVLDSDIIRLNSCLSALLYSIKSIT